jgi:hypothetical protein
MSPEEEPEERPQKLNQTVEVILTILVVTVAVIVIGGAVWHFVTTPAHPCYNQFGTTYNGHC